MRKYRMIIVAVLCVALMTACGKGAMDYDNAVAFEEALNNGENTVGKSVLVEVTGLVADSAFGYNLLAGEHLNFCSKEKPKNEINVGDTVCVKVTAVSIVKGSYIIRYKVL